MKVENIIINDDELIIINSDGGQHHIPTSNLSAPHQTWVDNIKACAISLMNDFKQSQFIDDEWGDYDDTLQDGLDDLEIWDISEL